MPVVSTVFGVLQAPLDARDLVALNEKKMLQRGYFSFLAALVSNDVSDVLRSQGTADTWARWRAPLIDGMPPLKFANNSASIDLQRTNVEWQLRTRAGSQVVPSVYGCRASFFSAVSQRCYRLTVFLEPQNLHQVMLTVVDGVVELADPHAQKACFTILRKLVEAWASDTNGLEGFKEFMYQKILPACFMAPMKPTFDLNDAQTCLV